MIIRRRWLVGLLAVGALVVGLCSARGLLLPVFAWWLDVGTQPQRADCVMVLLGDEDVRPFVAAALLRVGLARRVMVARCRTPADMLQGGAPPTHEIVRRVLLLRGVSDDQILILRERVDSTYEEAKALNAFLRREPNVRVTVVTSFYHTRRARWVFNRVLGARARQVSLVSAPADKCRPDNWWQVDDGAKVILAEYLKIAFYVARYGRLGYWAVCVALAVIFLTYWRRGRTTA